MDWRQRLLTQKVGIRRIDNKTFVLDIGDIVMYIGDIVNIIVAIVRKFPVRLGAIAS